MVRVAEIDRDTKEFFEPLVVLPQKVIVGRHGEPFGVPLFDAQACALHLEDGDGEDL